MRRIDLINGTTEIIEALVKNNIVPVLRSTFDRSKSDEDSGKPSISALEAFKGYSLAASKFSTAARQLVAIFGLSDLEDPRLWSSVFTSTSSSNRGITGEIFSLFQRVEFAIDTAPLVLGLIEQSSSDVAKKSFQASNHVDAGVVSVVIVEDDAEPSSVERIANILEGMETLYQSCAAINHIQVTSLQLVACDSGSDKTFDFLGHGKVIECAKNVFFQLWDRVVFFKERRSSEQIKLIAETLPVIEHIADLEQKEKIDHELAQKLRRSVVHGLDKIFSARVYIAEAENRIHYDPRLLAAPEQKLLTGSVSPDINLEGDSYKPNDRASEFDPSKLTPEQVQAFGDFLIRRQAGTE